MKIPKKANGIPAPSFMQEQGFYTEADIRKIVQEAVQEVITAWMAADEEADETPEAGHTAAGVKLTLSVQEAADLIGVSKPKMFELLQGQKIRLTVGGSVAEADGFYYNWNVTAMRPSGRSDRNGT